MNKRVLILGEGFIGKRIREAFNCNISKRKIRSFKDIEEQIKKYSPKILINCIGHTGKNNIDDCEKNLDKTLFANTFVPIILAEATLRSNIKLVHISSGCIYHYDYSHDTPINEDKTPNFFELFYSRAKIYADQALMVLSRKYPILIARIRIPLDNRPHPRNILTKLIKYRKVIDIPNSVTYIPDFIQALKHLIRIDARGVYNIVNRGGLRYPELLDVYKKYVPDFTYETIDYKKLNIVRTNLLLSTEKLKNTGFQVRDIKRVFRECIEAYIKS